MNQIGSVQPFADENDIVPVSLKESVEVFGRDVFQERQDLMDKQDLQLHKEVVTKAVSGILVWMVKGANCQHVLKAEYTSLLLVDKICAILILRDVECVVPEFRCGSKAAGQKGSGD
ncbi:hypothetical protein HDV00_012709 [Rhizophlyctis rosea]|nr:hypothetical protein HDV00_012709 [Rhizophlyctis rosea]